MGCNGRAARRYGVRRMIVTTTQSIEGRKITDYRGIVVGEAILGANAVVGVDLDYEVINNMLMVSASGTAVTVE